MPDLKTQVCAALRASQQEDCHIGDRCRLEQRLRRAFNKRLRYGSLIVPELKQAYKGDVLHTVIAIDQLSDECAVTSVAITVFSGGVLSSSGADRKKQNIPFRYLAGNGKAFKFLAYDPDQGVVKSRLFQSSSFPYGQKELERMKGMNGTVACVRGYAKSTFFVNGLCSVSDGRIDDLRLYTDHGKMIYDLMVLYEDLISDGFHEKDRIFRYLFS